MIERESPAGNFVLRVHGRRIPFHIERRRRKTLAITVHPDLRLEVVAPDASENDQVLLRVEKRAGWIVRQLRYFEQYRPIPAARQFVSGETHRYLGRQYRLKVAQGELESVKLIGQFLHVCVTCRDDRARVGALVELWYRRHAVRVFEQRIRACRELRPCLCVPQTPRVTVRKMLRRWGSCTKAGNVLLNLELIKTPVHCIDYVIVHELCHLQVHNHSPAFYELLSRMMPDWESRKRRLESLPFL